MLLRHAKSDWSDEGLLDVDRPLNARGKKAAPEMALWMRKHHWMPDRILCSTAKRTRETLERMQEAWQKTDPAWNPNLGARLVERLYLAPPQTMLEEAMAAASDVQSLLVIGHNPGIEMLATRLSDEPCEMRTCTLVVLEAQPSWPEDWWDSGSWTQVAKHRS
jgi:phosphohistidine phosphatase